jgi:hypothetical protein
VKIVRTMQDVQNALNELFTFKDKWTTGSWDNSGNKISNVGPGVAQTDVATMAQLPFVPQPTSLSLKYYTIVFESVGVITVGSNISAPFIAGRGRTGIPVQIWLAATNKPTTGPLAINMNVNGLPLLTNNLVMDVGDPSPQVSSVFNIPSQKVGYLYSVTPLVASVGGASLVSIGLVLQLDQS